MLDARAAFIEMPLESYVFPPIETQVFKVYLPACRTHMSSPMEADAPAAATTTLPLPVSMVEDRYKALGDCGRAYVSQAFEVALAQMHSQALKEKEDAAATQAAGPLPVPPDRSAKRPRSEAFGAASILPPHSAPSGASSSTDPLPSVPPVPLRGVAGEGGSHVNFRQFSLSSYLICPRWWISCVISCCTFG